MTRKGQAAMEFLMTYGWAILAAIIAIGVLAYFGVFSPGKYLPSVCTISSPLGCEEFKISVADGGVNLIIRNGAGANLQAGTIVSITNTPTGVVCDDNAIGTAIADGTIEDIVVTCSSLVAGNKFSGDISVNYLKEGATIRQTATGRITGQVEA